MADPVSGMAGAASGLGGILSGVAGIGNMISSFLPTTTTSSFSGQTNKTTQQTVFSDEAVQRMINQILQSSDGLQSLTQGQQSSGLFDSSTNQMLASDFLARVVGEVGKITAPVEATQELGPTQTKQKSKKCFITTAAVEYAKQEDDGHVLNTLRNFRDEYVIRRDPVSLEDYYREAPAIVEKLKADVCHKSIFTMLYEDYIVPAVQLIEKGQSNEAYYLYVDMFNKAKWLAFGPAAVPAPVSVKQEGE